MKYRILAIAVSSAVVAACATNPPPATQQVTPLPTPPIASLQAAPATVTANIPAWYIKQPESTFEAIYVAGSGLSRDLAMSHDKSVLDAQSHLADRIAGEISTHTKDYKREVGDEFAQSTEITARKIAADVKIIGYQVVDRAIYPEGGGYRVYTLLKFPLGNSNQMLQSYFNRKTFKGSKEAAERDLEHAREELRQRETHEFSLLVNQEPRPNLAKVGKVEDGGKIVVRETLASPESKPLGLNDGKEKD